MSMKLAKSWHEALKDELKQPYIQELKEFLTKEEKRGVVVYPPEPMIFQSFQQTPFHDVRVVIMGQDPYHGAGQAHGLSFSVPCGMPLPPSLRNIYQELHHDLKIPQPQHGCLRKWAEQGVLLLNATLTVRAGEPASHQGKGWERFTDSVIEKLSESEKPIVFMLWGKSAQQKCERLSQKKTHHAVLIAAHPSPYSVQNFFGCSHFSKANALLEKWGRGTIDWRID